MVFIEREVEETSEDLARRYLGVYGKDLIAVILYGSAVTADYMPRKSDLNFLIVLSEDGMANLHLAQGLASKWRGKRIATPLFLTKAYIESSLDSFPIEFLNIKGNHLVIFGEDVLEHLSFNKKDVRLQCERELKGKLLLLRERYVETKGRAKYLRELVSASIPTFIFVFKGLLYILDKRVPATKEETVRILGKELSFDQGLFLSLLKIKEGSFKPRGEEMEQLFRKYLGEIRQLALHMDTEQLMGAA